MQLSKSKSLNLDVWVEGSHEVAIELSGDLVDRRLLASIHVVEHIPSLWGMVVVVVVAVVVGGGGGGGYKPSSHQQ